MKRLFVVGHDELQQMREVDPSFTTCVPLLFSLFVSQ